MTRPNNSKESGKEKPKDEHRNFTIHTSDGKIGAIVTITGMGHEDSPEIVEDIDAAIRRKMGELIKEQPGDGTYNVPTKY